MNPSPKTLSGILLNCITFVLPLFTETTLKQTMGDNHLEDVVCKFNDVTDDLTDEQREQARVDVNEIDEKAKKVLIKVKEAVKSVRAAADFLDKVWMTHNIAHASGNVFGIIGGICTIGGGIATLMTAGVASPLLFAGLGFGLTGAGTNIVAKIIENAVKSDEIQKANNDLKEAYDSIDDVQKFVEDRLNRKKKSYLQYMYNFSAYLVSPSLRFLVAYLYSTGMVKGTGQTVAKAGVELTAQLGCQATEQRAQAASQAGAQAVGKAGAQAAGKAGAQAVGIAGAHAAGKAGAQAAGKAVAIDLSYTIYDLVQKKGFEAAKVLREKANKLEEQYIKNIVKL